MAWGIFCTRPPICIANWRCRTALLSRCRTHKGARDAQPYVKDLVRIASDGYVHAPTKPGLGYEIDRAALDKAITQIER